MAEEFVPMQKAAQELGMPPEALKQAISKRELPALMDGGTFKIRRTDLDRYKSRRQSEETLTLPPDEAADAEVVTGEVVEAGVVEAVPLEEPTLEAIEEAAETMDTEITLDELDAVQAEPPTATPAEPFSLDSDAEPSSVELASGSEATEELSLSDDLDPVSEEISLEAATGDEAATVNLEVEPGATQAMDSEQDLGDLQDPAEGGDGIGDGEDGLEARVHVLEVRMQGSPLFAAMTVLTCMVLVFVGLALWGFQLDHVPSYLLWMTK